MMQARPNGERGYAMVALMVGISIMAVALSVALPTFSTAARREREAELIFRGQQYARAIALFQRKNGNVFPPSFDLLVQGRFLRKKYKDPMTPDGEFQPVYAGQARAGGQAPQGGTQTALEELAGRTGGLPAQQPGGGGAAPGVTPATPGLIGVVSKSDQTSLRLYEGHDKYNEWVFVATQATTRAGAPNGAQRPGDAVPNGRGSGAGPGLPGPGAGLPPFPGRRGVFPGGRGQ